MFFSVLIAVYNAEKYVDRCIRSVIEQTEKDYELVIVDDGSTDNSPVICEKWASEYPELIRFVKSKNQGSLLARRKCFFEAKGDYFYFIDADDYIIDSNFLSNAKKRIKDSECDMLFFNATDNNNMSPRFPYNFNDFEVFENEDLIKIYDLVVNRSFNSLWTKIFKRSVLDWNNNYDEYKKISNGTDGFQMLPIVFNCSKIVYWNNVAYFYQVDNNSNSIIHKFNSRYYYSVRKMFERLRFYINSNKLIPPGYYDEQLRIRWLNSVVSAVYKVRQSNPEEKDKIISYLKEIRNDNLLAEYYTKHRINKLSVSRKVILKLLMSEHYNLLIILMRFVR